MTTTPTTMGTKVGRGRRGLSQLWQAPAFLIGLLALIAVAASTPWRLTPQQREFDRLLRQLRDRLQDGHSPDQLAGLAEEIKLRVSAFPARQAQAHFLVGSAYYRQARQESGPAEVELWRRATEHLESAYASASLPADDRLPLQYRLGYALYQRKKDVPRALELMSAAVEQGAEQPLDAYRMLVEAYLREAAPNLDAALAANRRVLDLTPAGDIGASARARLQLGELLLRKEQRAEAIQELERIGPKAPREVRLQARLLQARACEADGQWQEAAALWQQMLPDAAQVEGGRARVLYALGLCQHKMEPPNDAETVRVWAEALRLGGAAGQAAGLRLGRLRLLLAGMDVDQALADWKAAFATVNAPGDLDNAYVKPTEVRTWLDQAIRHFQEMQDPRRTQEVAELLRKIAPGGEADYQIARAAEAFAKQLGAKVQAKIDGVGPDEVAAQYRRAGAGYAQAAAALPEARRSDALWRGAQCFLAAKDAPQAQALLQKVVAAEKDDTRLANGWFTLGELYRDAGQKDIATKALEKCIEVGAAPFANKARFYLALERCDADKLDSARDILEQILRNPAKDWTDRPTQEQALFKLAYVLMRLEKYNEAHVRLKEFILLFPHNPNALLAREQYGECYRRLAEAELRREMEERQKTRVGDEFLKSAQQKLLSILRERRIALLSEAINAFRDLADELNAKERKGKLTDLEQVLLRRATFDVGECCMDGEEYGEAMRTFEAVQSKHRRTVEGMFASKRIVALAEVLPPPRNPGDPDFRAGGLHSLQLLQEDLQAMPPEHEVFRMPRVDPRDAWLRFVQEKRLKLQTPPRTEGRKAFP